MSEAITAGSYRKQDVSLLFTELTGPGEFGELADRRLLPAQEYRPAFSLPTCAVLINRWQRRSRRPRQGSPGTGHRARAAA